VCDVVSRFDISTSLFVFLFDSQGADGLLKPATWQQAMVAIAHGLQGVQGNEFKAIAGDTADAESIICLKDMMNKRGSNNLHTPAQGADLANDFRSSYVMNSSINGIDEADAILLVGTNPRMEAPIINARIRKQATQRRIPVAVVGPDCNLTYEHDALGESTAALADVVNGDSDFAAAFKAAKKPMVIVGAGAVETSPGVSAAVDALVAATPALRSGEWNGVNMLQAAAARTAALDVGFAGGSKSADTPVKAVYLLAHDELKAGDVPDGAFVVYQGIHGDAGASAADVILPGGAYTEKHATYVNTEGRTQRTTPMVTFPGEAREDWTIIRALSECLQAPIGYNTLEDVRERLVDVAPHLGAVGTIQTPSVVPAAVASSAAPVTLVPSIDNFWRTNPVARNSKTMAACANNLPNATNSYL
jgi:NADH-quinone oxidoreductase subunit G